MSEVDRSGTFSLSPSDYLLDINKVLLVMADNELLLNSSELSGGLYEDFSSQEDTLRVSCTAILTMQNQNMLYCIVFLHQLKVIWCCFLWLFKPSFLLLH